MINSYQDAIQLIENLPVKEKWQLAKFLLTQLEDQSIHTTSTENQNNSTRELTLQRIMQRFDLNPIPANAPVFSREELHERR